MHPRWRHLGSLIGAAAVVGLGWWLYPTDARRIRAACHELVESVSVPAQEPDVARLARLGQLAKHLAVDVIVEAEGIEARIEGREQVLALAGRLQAPRAGVTVTLDDVDVTVGEDRRSADVQAVAMVREPGSDGGQGSVERRRLTLAWTKTGEGWRLAHVVVTLPQDGVRRPPEG